MDAKKGDKRNVTTKSSLPPIPTSILGIYSHYLKMSADGKPILVHGFYQHHASAIVKDGFYYDTLKSDRDELSIQIKLSPELRNLLKDNHLYLFMGIIEENISLEKVELIFWVNQIIGEFDSLISVEEKKVMQANFGIQKTDALDFKQVIKHRMQAGRSLSILMITGDRVLIPESFKKALGPSIKYTMISVLHCLGMNEEDTVELVRGSVSKSYDAIVLAGTWWNKFEWACNNRELIQLLEDSKVSVITVYGYNRNKTLLDKISHKQFRSLKHFGSRLKVMIDSIHNLR